ncbi:hypothetical protein KDA23_00895, partial [Candidatus Saccharibacteria bacterium]|nr:hypothetical protein [Candidatus Saccharibacteria bacterium]
VFPTQWLLNGVDNSIGAHWQASYRSAVDSYYTDRHATFDSGTNGATVTESSAATFDNCVQNSPGTSVYSNSQYITPGLSMRVDSGAGGSAWCAATWSTYHTSIYARFYARFDNVSPGNITSIWRAVRNGGSTNVGAIRISPAGKIVMREASNNVYTSTGTLSANTWYRFEVSIDGSAFVLRVYDGSNLHGDQYDTSFSSVQTVSDTGGFDQANLGIISTVTPTWGAYFDDYKTSLSSWQGSAFPGWGQTTNFGDVTLGTLNTFTPKDSVGSNTSFARWYYFSLSIDASQTFGYPEDVTRGPTIADLSLFYTADPSKRLMHGRTFNGGEQQPLDTPKYSN